MQATRLLLIPLSIASLSILVAACGGDNDSNYKTTSYPTSAPASISAASSAAGPATGVVAAAATPVQPAPISTTAPAALAPAAPAAAVVATTPVPPPAPAAPAAATLNLTIADFMFSPNAMTVKTGQAVTVNVRNAGPSTHTFSLQTGPSTGNVAGGTSTTLQFTAPSQPGTISFRCMIHASMTGQITVTN